MALDLPRITLLDGAGPHPWLFRVSLPNGDLLTSKIGYASRGAAEQYDGRLKSCTFPQYGPSDRGGSIRAVEMSMDYIDMDRKLARRIEGREQDVKRSPLLVRQAHPALASDRWADIFTGVLVSISWPEPLLARLRFRVDDDVIQHMSPKPYTRITVDTWPKAKADSWGKIARPIYGTHDSLGFTGKGFVEAYLVDKEAHTYLLSIGRCLAVMRAYGSDKLLSSANWSWGYMARRGTWYTTLALTPDAYAEIYGEQWTNADAPGQAKLVEQTRVAVDCAGFESTGLGKDGGGALIQNPIDQLLHYLSNFVIGSWRRGSWLSTSDRLGDASHLRQFFAERGYKGAQVVSQPGKGTDQIAAWLASMECVAYWWTDGLLYFDVDDFTETDVYPEGPYAYQEKLDLEEEDDRQVVGETVGKFVRDDSSGSFLATVSARDPQATTEASTTIEQEWGSAA